MTPEERRWAFSWVDLALDYQEQNRELRDRMAALLFEIAKYRDTYKPWMTFGQEEIDRRWPDEEGRAA